MEMAVTAAGNPQSHMLVMYFKRRMDGHVLITPRIQTVSVSYLGSESIYPRPVRVGFMVNKVALGYVFLGVLWFPRARIIPPFSRIYPVMYHWRYTIFAFDNVDGTCACLKPSWTFRPLKMRSLCRLQTSGLDWPLAQGHMEGDWNLRRSCSTDGEVSCWKLLEVVLHYDKAPSNLNEAIWRLPSVAVFSTANLFIHILYYSDWDMMLNCVFSDWLKMFWKTAYLSNRCFYLEINF
jgi:hypothetical protein